MEDRGDRRISIQECLMELLAQFELGSERTIIVDGDHDHSTLWSEADHSGFGAEIHEDPQHIDPRTIPAVPGRGRREEIGLERNRDEATVGTDDHGPLFEHHQVVQAFTLWQWMVRGATLLHIEDAHPELRPDKDPPSHRVEGAHVVMEDTHLLSNRGVETQRQIDDVSLGAAESHRPQSAPDRVPSIEMDQILLEGDQRLTGGHRHLGSRYIG